MSRRRYPTDLTEKQWMILEPLVAAVKPGGRPATHPRREIAGARTGFAQPYLVYGEMVRPLDVGAPAIAFDYLLYNVDQSHSDYEETGVLRVPNVMHAAWRAPDGRLGFLFINLQRDQPATVPITLDPTRYGIPAGTGYTVSRVTGDSADIIAGHPGPAIDQLTLRPRQVTLLEVQPTGSMPAAAQKMATEGGDLRSPTVDHG